MLLLSALLTAGYLLPLTINGFFPGADYDYKALVKREPCALMTVPVLILVLLCVALGLFPGVIVETLAQVAQKVL